MSIDSILSILIKVIINNGGAEYRYEGREELTPDQKRRLKNQIMSIFEVMGPIMIGPSSSHTAGSVKLGKLARFIAGKKVQRAVLKLHGSFATTYRGHGTDKALIAGLLGFDPDDVRIRRAFTHAEENDLQYEFEKIELRGVHPNTVIFELYTEDKEKLTIRGSSLGGGEVIINSIDEYEVEITGKYDTLWIVHKDMPGMVGRITALLGSYNVNIASMKNQRRKKRDVASSIIELDQIIPDALFEHLKNIPDIDFVRRIPGLK